jgi:acetyltransferase-like isoleucine patch superfamily enzyme
MPRDLTTSLAYASKKPIIGTLAYFCLKLLGVEFPRSVKGRSDIHRPMSDSKFEGIIIEDDVVLSPGCKVLCKEGCLRVGRGTVIGANAVLLESTGDWEIWAGIPAKLIGKREPVE